VLNLVESPLHVQKDSERELLQIGIPGGIRIKLEIRVDGGTFRPESKLLRGKEVVCFEEVFQAIGENFLKNLPCNVQEGYWAVWKGIR
jgi:hypothetical protein